MQTSFFNLITIINKSPGRLDRLRPQDQIWEIISQNIEQFDQQLFNFMWKSINFKNRFFLIFNRDISFSSSKKLTALAVNSTKNTNECQTGKSIINFFEISHLRSHNNMNGFSWQQNPKNRAYRKQSHKNKSKAKRQTRAIQSRQKTHPPGLKSEFI